MLDRACCFVCIYELSAGKSDDKWGKGEDKWGGRGGGNDDRWGGRGGGDRDKCGGRDSGKGGYDDGRDGRRDVKAYDDDRDHRRKSGGGSSSYGGRDAPQKTPGATIVVGGINGLRVERRDSEKAFFSSGPCGVLRDEGFTGPCQLWKQARCHRDSSSLPWWPAQ